MYHIYQLLTYFFSLNWVFPQLKLLYLFTMKDKSSAKKLINIESQRLPTDFKMGIGEGPLIQHGQNEAFLVLMT